MGRKWEDYRLSDIITIIGGGTPKRSISEYWDGSIPWLSVKDFNDDFRHVFKANDSITEEGLNKSSTTLLKEEQIIISARGTVGALAQVSTDMAFNQSCYGIDAKTEYTDNNFLYYLMKYSITKLKRITHGAVFDTITKETFNHINVSIPNRQEQKIIAHILGSLDDKIELNRKMNDTLEAMAQALFKSWFVDFDPVIDNALEAGNEIPDELLERAAMRKALGDKRKVLPSDVKSLFPSEFEFTDEMGWIPKGWILTSLGNEIDFLTGFPFKSKQFSNSPPGIILARGMNVKEGVFFWESQARYWTKDITDLKQYLLEAGDILIGMDGSKIGKNWVRVAEHELPCLLVQRVARLRQNKSIGECYLQILISSLVFKQYIDLVKTGTTIPHISGAQLKSLSFLRPPVDDNRIFYKFESEIIPYMRKMDFNNAESKSHSKIRDILLPKLLSGTVQVSKNTV